TEPAHPGEKAPGTPAHPAEPGAHDPGAPRTEPPPRREEDVAAREEKGGGGGGAGGLSGAPPTRLDTLKAQRSELKTKRDAAFTRADRSQDQLQNLREFLDKAEKPGARQRYKGKSVQQVKDEVADLERLHQAQTHELHLAEGELAEVEGQI